MGRLKAWALHRGTPGHGSCTIPPWLYDYRQVSTSFSSSFFFFKRKWPRSIFNRLGYWKDQRIPGYFGAETRHSGDIFRIGPLLMPQLEAMLEVSHVLRERDRTSPGSTLCPPETVPATPRAGILRGSSKRPRECLLLN